MTMPGFNAETSLYKTSGRYRASASECGALSSSESVVLAYFPGLETQARCNGCLEGCVKALAYCSIGPAATFAACGWWNPICTAAAALAQGACNLASVTCEAVCALTTCCPNSCSFPNPLEPGKGCCDEGENCVDFNDKNSRHGCCPSDQSVCGGKCCTKGDRCCGNECCPAGWFCSDGVCTQSVPFPSGPPPEPEPPQRFDICPWGKTPCNGKCCEPGLECCPDGVCKWTCVH